MQCKSKKYDYLIVGQGLAGSILALTLIERGNSVLVIDQGTHASASHVAAGIINPITGHRLNLTQGFAPYFKQANSFYLKLNKRFNAEIYQSISQYRQIKNHGQWSYLQKRLQQPEYQSYLVDPKFSSTNLAHSIFKPFEFPTVAINKSAIVDCAKLLYETRAQLKNDDALIQSTVNYSAMRISTHGVNYQGISAEKIIFCEGAGALENPWLKDLPFKLSKGHVASVKLSQEQESLLNWGRWLAPTNSEQIAKLGSNYQWGDRSLEVSDKAIDELLQNLRDNTNLKANLVGAVSGIRPTTKYRQPFIGPISGLVNAYCFNGFGSKGCLMIPYYANRLVDYFANGHPLPNEVTRCL